MDRYAFVLGSSSPPYPPTRGALLRRKSLLIDNWELLYFFILHRILIWLQQSLEEVSLRMVTQSASTSPGLTCCTETIEALLKESEDLIADLSSLASQISPQNEETLERSSDKSIISTEERLKRQDGPFTKEVKQEEISFEPSIFTDDEQKVNI